MSCDHPRRRRDLQLAAVVCLFLRRDTGGTSPQCAQGETKALLKLKLFHAEFIWVIVGLIL